MALLLQEAEKLSLDDLRMGIVEEIVTEDPMFQYLNFIQANAGKTHTYVRESKEEVVSDFRLPGEQITEGSSDVDPVTLVIKALIGDTDIDSFIQDTMSDHFDQTAVQISARAKSVARKFRHTLVNGGNTTAALPTGSGNPTTTGTSGGLWLTSAISGTANIHGGTGVIRVTEVATAAQVAAGPALYRGPSGVLTTTPTGTLVYSAVVLGEPVAEFKAPGDSVFGRPINIIAAASSVIVLPSASASKAISVTTATAVEANGGTVSTIGDGVNSGDAHIVVEFTEQAEFAGILNLVDSGQIINASGGALGVDPNTTDGTAASEYLSWGDLDQLHDKLRGYGAPMHVAGLSQVRAYKRLLRSAGGTNSAMLQMENFARPVLSLEDAPVFKNDFIDETGTTSSWFGIQTGDQGLTGVYAGNTAGVAVEDLGPRETTNARGYRVKLYGALALYSTQSLVQISNLSTVSG